MSRFFKALERAEQDRALQRSTPSSPVGEPASVVSPAETVPVRWPQPVPEPPRGAVSGSRERAAEVEEHLVSLLAPASFEAEQYRALRHMIEQLHRASELSVIAVSSPDANEGKTTTCINLAGTLAQAADARVLLVDADLRGSNLAVNLGLDDETCPGLVDAILDTRLTLERVTQALPHFNLSVVTAGRRSSSPYEVLKSPRAGELLAEARRRFDYVIVDTSPLVSAPDSRVIEKWVDGVLIVVAAHRTPRRLLEAALNLVEPAKIMGLVFNGDDRHLLRDTYSSRRRHVVPRSSRRRQTASDE
jgi:capsular exopolysaccharide synthesis family protein